MSCIVYLPNSVEIHMAYRRFFPLHYLSLFAPGHANQKKSEVTNLVVKLFFSFHLESKLEQMFCKDLPTSRVSRDITKNVIHT